MIGGENPVLKWIWPAIILGSIVALTLLTFLNVSLPARVVLTFWFLGFCPGLAFVCLLDVKDLASQIALSIGISLALDMLVSELIIFLGMWSFQTGLIILDVLTLAAVCVGIVKSLRVRMQSRDIRVHGVDS